MSKPPDLAHWRMRQTIPLRATPRAGVNSVTEENGPEGARLAVRITAAPEDGKANKAVIKLVAKALGTPPSALSLLRGAKSRDKILTLDADWRL